MKVQCAGWHEQLNRVCPEWADVKVDQVPLCAVHYTQEQSERLAYRIGILENQITAVIRAAASSAEHLERPRTASALLDLL